MSTPNVTSTSRLYTLLQLPVVYRRPIIPTGGPVLSQLTEVREAQLQHPLQISAPNKNLTYRLRSAPNSEATSLSLHTRTAHMHLLKLQLTGPLLQLSRALPITPSPSLSRVTTLTERSHVLFLMPRHKPSTRLTTTSLLLNRFSSDLMLATELPNPPRRSMPLLVALLLKSSLLTVLLPKKNTPPSVPLLTVPSCGQATSLTLVTTATPHSTSTPLVRRKRMTATMTPRYLFQAIS